MTINFFVNLTLKYCLSSFKFDAYLIIINKTVKIVLVFTNAAWFKKLDHIVTKGEEIQVS